MRLADKRCSRTRCTEHGISVDKVAKKTIEYLIAKGAFQKPHKQEATNEFASDHSHTCWALSIAVQVPAH